MSTRLRYGKIDWQLILTYLALIIVGWVSVFSSVYDEESTRILDFSQRHGMQLVWICASFILAYFIIFILNPKLYNVMAWWLYAGSLILLTAVIFLGVEINGSKSWFMLGPIRFQPAEISKITTSLALASMMSAFNFRLKSMGGILKVGLTILIPMLMIILEKETGSALIYTGFVFMLYREGLSGWFLSLGLLAILLFLITLSFSPFIAIIVLFAIVVIARGVIQKRLFYHILFVIAYTPILYFAPYLQKIHFVSKLFVLNDIAWLAIFIIPIILWQVVVAIKLKSRAVRNIILCFFAFVALIFSVEFFFNSILQEHQRGRIEIVLGIKEDIKGLGYNVHQSKIAIGSGGFTGKGFLQGTQTKFNFVPEQSTDFIFCTVGEEWGFLGSVAVIFLYIFMIIRILNLAEKQKDSFTRIYGYCVASAIFLHFFINIGMTIGIMPVIGIPLPFVSYGGSSLLTFTALLFIFIRLDLERWR